MCGDLNARFGSGSREEALVSDAIDSCNLNCLPFDATYHTRDCDSTLDVIASNCNELVADFGQMPAPGFSYHDLYAVFNLKRPPPGKKSITYRDFKSLNVDSLLNDAEKLEWRDVLQSTSADKKVSVFNRLLLGLFDKHAPIRTACVKHYRVPWMNYFIKRMLAARDRARKKHLRTKDPADYEFFKVLRNKVKQEIRNAKVRHLQYMTFSIIVKVVKPFGGLFVP